LGEDSERVGFAEQMQLTLAAGLGGARGRAHGFHVAPDLAVEAAFEVVGEPFPSRLLQQISSVFPFVRHRFGKLERLLCNGRVLY